MCTQLVFFDFDGTLTKKDSLPYFLHFVGGKFFWYKLPILIWYVLLHKLGFLCAQTSKERLFGLIFAGKQQQELEELGRRFAHVLLQEKERFFRPQALECLEKYKKSGARVYIISASLGLWVTPLAHSLGVASIATECLFEQGYYAGKFAGENCNGKEKVRRIRQEITHIESYTNITAYGDSKGDIPMLNLAHDAYFKPFREKE